MAKTTDVGLPPIIRVNLLPPELAQRRAFKAALRQAGLFGAIGLAALLGMFIFGTLQVRSAQHNLDTAMSAQASAQADVTKYQTQVKDYDRLATREAQYTLAMSREIPFSQYLYDIGTTIPAGTTLKSLTLTNKLDTAPVPAVNPISPAVSVGTASFEVATPPTTYATVTQWLETFRSLHGISNLTYSGATKTPQGISFSVTSVLNPTAYDQCYQLPLDPKTEVQRQLRKGPQVAFPSTDPFNAGQVYDNVKCGDLK